MARLTGFTLGELRGKMGGLVFSRNKAGAYIRALVTPVNPQTVRQQTARYSFGNNSILFQNLSSFQKNCWETFARTHFNPLKGNSTGIYSGGNAFVALRSSVNQGNTYNTLPTSAVGPDSYTMISSGYNIVIDPPSTPSSATIFTDNAQSYPFLLENIAVNSNGRANFDLVLQGVPIASIDTYQNFRNAEGHAFGIGLYMSNNLKFMGAKPNTALKLNFVDTGVIRDISESITSGSVLVTDTLSIEATPNIVAEDIRDFPCAGDVILVTPFIRTEDGVQKLLAPQYVTVS